MAVALKVKGIAVDQALKIVILGVGGRAEAAAAFDILEGAAEPLPGRCQECAAVAGEQGQKGGFFLAHNPAAAATGSSRCIP